jgi:hypothetical protein
MITSTKGNNEMKYQILDDSHGSIHGQVVFESDERAEANKFYNEYEAIGDNVGLFQRTPKI